jgi:hypothetical protein
MDPTTGEMEGNQRAAVTSIAAIDDKFFNDFDQETFVCLKPSMIDEKEF